MGREVGREGCRVLGFDSISAGASAGPEARGTKLLHFREGHLAAVGQGTGGQTADPDGIKE